MKKDDIVRIVRVAGGQSPFDQGLVGTVCYVEEIWQGKDGRDYAALGALDLSGKSLGGGSMPLDCLVPETGPEWEEAKRKHDSRLDALARHRLQITSVFMNEIEKVAAEHGLTVHDVLAVGRAYKEQFEAMQEAIMMEDRA